MAILPSAAADNAILPLSAIATEVTTSLWFCANSDHTDKCMNQQDAIQMMAENRTKKFSNHEAEKWFARKEVPHDDAVVCTT